MNNQNNANAPSDDLAKDIQRIFSVAGYLRRLPARKLVNSFLALIVAVCSSSAKPLLDRGLAEHRYYAFAISVAAGLLAFIWLFIRVRRRRPKGRPSAPVLLKGLSSFSENDGEIFAKLGRDTETRRCLGFLRDPNTPIIAIYGASGSGKTSLLRAGIHYSLETETKSDVAAQKSKKPFVLYWSAVGTEPAEALAGMLQRTLGISCHGDPTTLLKGQSVRLTLIIDQFERLHHNHPQHAPIFDLIRGTSSQPTPHGIQIVIAFNLDYYIEWINFENEAQLTAEKIPVGRFAVPRASRVMETILSAAQIEIDSKVIDRYISDVADKGEVSPVAIALGALVLSQWKESAPDGEVPLQDYARAGGAMAVLSAHVRQRLDPPFVTPEHRQPLLRALITTLVDADCDQTNPLGASGQKIAEASGLKVELIGPYLNDLVANRILEIVLQTSTYVLAHEHLVPVLRELAKDTTKLEQTVIEKYLLWKHQEKRKNLITGKRLDWALVNIRRFVVGPDAIDRANYLNRSVDARKQRYFGLVALVLVLVVAGFTSRHYLLVSAHQRELTNSNLPRDLYDRQDQLESLDIEQSFSNQPGANQAALGNLNWLRSSSLTDLKIASPKLASIAGLSALTQLRSLDIDLESASLDSLSGLSDLSKLQSLTLRRIGRSQAVPDISNLRALKTLDLDFGGSQISSLPDLTSLQDLENLTLNLRGTAISALPDLSGLPQLHSVTLFLDGSLVHSLSALSKLDHVNALALSLSRDQFRYLSELNNSKASFNLTLYVGSFPLVGLPNLADIRGLRGLVMQMPGSVAGQLVDLAQITQLRSLEISLMGSNMRALPDLGQLKDLRSLTLGLESSALTKLPDFSKLQRLERLALNLNSTGIENLPDFEQFGEINEIDLWLRETKVRSLHNLQRLNKLQVLTLAISGSQVDDIKSVADIKGLQKLSCYLRWSQVADLPDFSQLAALRSVDLHMEGGWPVQELPRLSGLQSLTELGLFLENSRSKQLPDLARLPQLRKIALNLQSSSIEDLSALARVNGLEELSLDLQGSSLGTLPDLAGLKNLRSVSADIRRSRIKDLRETQKLAKLQELTIDQGFESLKDLPATVKKLHIGR